MESLLQPGHRTGQNKYITVPTFKKSTPIKTGTSIRSMAPPQRRCIILLTNCASLTRPHDNIHVYNIHCGKRWDSVICMVLSKKQHNISYTGSVQHGYWYHVAIENKLLGLSLLKARSVLSRQIHNCDHYATIDGVTINAIQWMGNKYVAFASTQFGISEMRNTRRTGRHKFAIPCPDSNDLMR